MLYSPVRSVKRRESLHSLPPSFTRSFSVRAMRPIVAAIAMKAAA